MGDEALRDAVLAEVQSRFPLASRPYDELATRLGAVPADVFAAVERLRDEGVVRRIGASFSSARLGFSSVLCALAVGGDEERVDGVAALVSAHPEVTHNYLRDDRYNLWFTVIAESLAARDSVLDAIVTETGCDDLLVLPATALYKIRVDFSGAARSGRPHGRGCPAQPAAVATPVVLDAFDRALVRWAQGDACGEQPFAQAATVIAGELGDPRVDEERVIARLREWADDGTMRRFGAMVRHRTMGYLFNGMCVFDADPARIDALGAALAGLPFVSHCYARPRSERWPYNLYAMAHAKTADELDAHVEEMRALAGLVPKVLVSSKEYKKTSPIYFP